MSEAVTSPSLHPFNHTFSWRSSPVGGHGLSPEQAARFDEQGFLLHPGAFDADQVARAILEIDFHNTGVFMFHAHQAEFAELGWMGFFNVCSLDGEAHLPASGLAKSNANCRRHP